MTQHAYSEKYCADVAAREAATELSAGKAEAMATSGEDDVDHVKSESYLHSFLFGAGFRVKAKSVRLQWGS